MFTRHLTRNRRYGNFGWFALLVDDGLYIAFFDQTVRASAGNMP